ncbi:MAG: hypothetical protein WCJ60_03430 [bacterium]
MTICIDHPLIVIGSLTLTQMMSYEVNYSKLWKDADRNMNGDVSATFIGIFPNIDAETTPLTQAEVQTLCTALDQPYFSATFWDPSSGTQKTANYYASDYKIKLINRVSGMYGQVTFSIVPISKRA